MVLLMTTGCQLTSEQPAFSALHYYLQVKSVSEEELSAQVTQHKTHITDQPDIAKLKLTILYAVPKTKLHNPFTAKTFLNQVNAHTFTHDNRAFIALLRDQLNLQIGQLNSNRTLKTQVELQQNMARQQEQEIKQLKGKIEQLKDIETSLQEQQL